MRARAEYPCSSQYLLWRLECLLRYVAVQPALGARMGTQSEALFAAEACVFAALAAALLAQLRGHQYPRKAPDSAGMREVPA